MQQAHERDFAGFDIEFDNYGSTNSPENRTLCERDLAVDPQGRAGQGARRRAALRSAGRHVPGRSVRPRHLSQVQIARSARRQLQQVRPPLQPDRADRSAEHAQRRDAGVAQVAALVHRTRTAARLSGGVDAIGRTLAARDRQLLEGPFPRRAAARLGHLAARAVLRLRDSRQPRQLLVRLVRRPDRLHGLDAAMVRPHGREARRLVALARLRDSPLHRQGHHVFPHAVLARHAQDGRLQPAGEGPHPRLSDRRRREDVEEQGHVRRARAPT